MTNRIESGIDVNVPVNVAYAQWTQFETFPEFMEHVEEVKQLDDRHLQWRVNIGGQVREFRAEITEQVPDKRIAWNSIAGPSHSGVVTFHRLTADKSRVMLQLRYDPQGFLEKLGSLVGLPKIDVAADLRRFAEFIERRRMPTGKWTGEIPNPDERKQPPMTHEHGS